MLLLKMNDEETFVIEDLDECHLFINEKYMDRLKEKFDMAMEENVYRVLDQEVKATW
jgi:hypothetical protein